MLTSKIFEALVAEHASHIRQAFYSEALALAPRKTLIYLVASVFIFVHK